MPASATPVRVIFPYLEGVPFFPTGNVKDEPAAICLRKGPFINELMEPPLTVDVLELVSVNELMELVVIAPFCRYSKLSTLTFPPPDIVSPEGLFILKS